MVPLQAIYLRCRLVAVIDEPFRTRAISQLRLILEFRKGHYPPTNVPLRLPPLAHDLAGEAQCILRFLVQRERVNFPPLHLPSVKMVEIKGRPWSKSVFNFRTFLRSWTPGKPQECDCRMWHKENTGHLFSHVRQILPCSPLADLNLNDTTFLSDKQRARIADKELRLWCNRWRLPDYLTVYAQDFSSGCNINYNCITVRYNRRILSCYAPPSVILDSFEDWSAHQ